MCIVWAFPHFFKRVLFSYFIFVGPQKYLKEITNHWVYILSSCDYEVWLPWGCYFYVYCDLRAHAWCFTKDDEIYLHIYIFLSATISSMFSMCNNLYKVWMCLWPPECFKLPYNRFIILSLKRFRQSIIGRFF